MKKPIALAASLTLCLSLAGPALAAEAPHAELSGQMLKVDGTLQKCEKYNIGGSNYFKLRDLACMLMYTGSQFGVGWDAASNTVSITTGKVYEPNSRELLLGGDKSATAQPSAQTILVDGQVVEGLSVYNIGGSNFFKLRDLGDALGFDVDYDADTNTAIVNSRPEKFLVSKYVENSTYTDEEYDEDGNVVSEKEGKYVYTSTTTYNDKGQVLTEHGVSQRDGEPDEISNATYTYNEDGTRASYVYEYDGSTTTTTYAYDAKGNVTREEVVYSDSMWDDETREYTYNDRGLKATETTVSGDDTTSIEYEYDANGNVVKEITTFSDGDVTTEVYTYDQWGNQLTRTYSGYNDFRNETVTTYNDAGQTLTSTFTSDWGDGDKTVSISTYRYDDAGNLVEQTYTDTSVWDGERKEESTRTVYTYDAAGRMLSSAWTSTEGNTLVYTYTYDAAGNTLTSSCEDSSEDGESWTSTYEYDANGNLVREVMTDSEGTSTTTYTYDANGNLLKQESTNGNSIVWEYVSLG